MASYIINLDSRCLRAALESSEEATRTQAMADLEDTKQRLAQLHEHRNRVTYAHLELLDLYDVDEYRNEELATAITGTVTSGSINIDGNSAIRRTCTLGLAIKDEIAFSDYYWTMNSKFQIWIGLENIPHIDFSDIKEKYSDLVVEVTNSDQLALGNNIIWLNEGQFIIGSFSAQQTTNNWTINLSGKDLMCRLNGEIGGTFIADETLNYFEDEFSFDGNLELDLGQTIQNVVKRFCPKCIVDVNDVYNEWGKELYRYSGDTPMYAFLSGDQLIGFTVYGDQKVYYNGDVTPISNCTSGATISFGDNNTYTLRVIEYGESIGEKKIQLMYPDKLIAKSGETATSVLDKIKACFTGFEYYFDTNGDFIFRKKRGYVDLAGTSTVEYSTIEYTFEDASLLTSMSITPSLSDFKNDYVVWGTQKSNNGVESDLLMHYVFDNKPIEYYALREAFSYNELFNNDAIAAFNVTGEITQDLVVKMKYYTSDAYDWRELLYQMAQDSNYFASVREQLKKDIVHDEKAILVVNTFIDKWSDMWWYSKQYEIYFPELRFYWRRLYNPEAESYYNLTTWSYEPKEEETLHRTKLLEANDKDTYNFEDYYYKDEEDNYYHISSYGGITGITYDMVYNNEPLVDNEDNSNKADFKSVFDEALQNIAQPKGIYYNGHDFIEPLISNVNNFISVSNLFNNNLFVYEFTYIHKNTDIGDGDLLLQSVKLTSDTSDDVLKTVKYPAVDIKTKDETRRVYVSASMANDIKGYFCLGDKNNKITTFIDLRDNLTNPTLMYWYSGTLHTLRPDGDATIPNVDIYYKTVTPDYFGDDTRRELYDNAVLKINLKELKEALSSFKANSTATITSDWIDAQLKKYPSGFMPFLHWVFNVQYGWKSARYNNLQIRQFDETKKESIFHSFWINYNQSWRSQKYLYFKDIDGNLTPVWETAWNDLKSDKNLYRFSRNSDEYEVVNLEDARILYQPIYQTDIYGMPTENYTHKYYDYYVHTVDYLKDRTNIKEKFFNRAYLEDRTTARYWLEFLDPNEMTCLPDGKAHWQKLIPVRAGRRLKTSNNNKINAMWLPESHDLVLNDLTETAQLLLTQLTIGKTAEDEIYEMLYNHSYATETITLNSIPLYFLSPNTIIRLGQGLRGHNNQRSIVVAGDYVLTKFSIPLTYNGTSSLTLMRKPTAEWFPLDLNGKYREAEVIEETLNLITDKEGIYILSIDGENIEIKEEGEQNG